MLQQMSALSDLYSKVCHVGPTSVCVISVEDDNHCHPSPTRAYQHLIWFLDRFFFIKTA
jgi:hypothetical protein